MRLPRFIAFFFVLTLAAFAADAATAAVPASAPFSWASLLNEQVIASLVAVIGTVWGFLKHTQATGLKKALGAAVVGVEQFSLTPEGAAVGDKLKSLIKAKASEHPKTAAILADAVHILTPAVQAQVAALTAVPTDVPTPAAKS